MNSEQQELIVKRLRSIAGHVNGIERMLVEDAYCIDVIKQVQAVQA
ncbi:MAG TPA: metal-sensing transcriptional repressor, partial [Anaerolineae bacterium]|nr:metal-sensing transcriptional repressor [Anaerolineae bacterium]